MIADWTPRLVALGKMRAIESDPPALRSNATLSVTFFYYLQKNIIEIPSKLRKNTRQFYSKVFV